MTIYILLVENGCKDNSFLTLIKVVFSLESYFLEDFNAQFQSKPQI